MMRGECMVSDDTSMMIYILPLSPGLESIVNCKLFTNYLQYGYVCLFYSYDLLAYCYITFTEEAVLQIFTFLVQCFLRPRYSGFSVTCTIISALKVHNPFFN